MKQVLFVCVHNAGRSQMAESLLNHLAVQKNLPLHATSAGTAPGGQINPAARMVMAELGISLDQHEPKLLTAEMAAGADRVITMGCGVDASACPATMHITEDWGLDDPAGEGIAKVREIRDQIHDRVRGLAAEMTAAG